MKKVLFLLVTLIILMGMILKGTFGYFSDDETSSGSTFSAWQVVTVTLLDDGFEGGPWDGHWDGNGTTTWIQKNAEYHSGQWAAFCDKKNPV